MDIATALIQKIKTAHTLYIATFLFFITFIIYANTLGNGLFFDDEDFIYKNVYVQQLNLPAYFTENTIAGAGKVSNYYRPFLSLSYGIEYSIFHDLPFIYHLTNILLQSSAGIALFIFLKRLLKDQLIAFLTSLLFLVHPIQTEAVSYASGRSDPMVAFFIFLSLIFFLKKSPRARIISLIFFICALFSRETALVMPGLLCIILLYQTKSLKKALHEIHQIIPFVVIDGFYFVLRLTVLNFQNTLNFYGTQNLYSSHLENRIYTFLSVLPTYFLLLVFPITLYMERNTSFVINPLDPRVLLSFFVLLVAFIASLRIFKTYPIFLFSLLWIGITFVPTSGIIPINGIIYEHFLFLPSIGFFLICSTLIEMAFYKSNSPVIKSCIVVVVATVLLLLSVRTISRNFEWHDPITFYTQLNLNNPSVARVHNNLAMAYAEEENNKQAISEYKRAIQLNDIYPQTHYNLGNTYIASNNIKEAEQEYKTAIKMDPNFLQPYISLGKLYKATDQKKYDAFLISLQTFSKKNKTLIPVIEYLKSL